MRVLLVILMIFFSICSFGYETTATLSFDKQAISFGDFAKANLRVLYLRQVVEEDVKKLEGTTFLDFFHISKVNSVSQNPNNPQVWDIGLTLVPFKKIKSTQVHIWSYKGLNIPVDIKNYEQPKEIKIPKDFNVLNVDYSNPYIFLFVDFSNPVHVSILITLIILVVFIVIRFFKKNLVKDPSDEIKKQWKNIILKSESREDYEYIYKERAQWLEFFNASESEMIYKKISYINTCQYKKEWSDIELHNVSDCFDDLKTIVEERWA